MIFDKLPALGAFPKDGGTASVMRDWRKHLKEDLANLRSGILDYKSFIAGYSSFKGGNAVEVVVRDKGGNLKQVIRNRNLRTTMGRDQWQRLLMFGNISANATFATAIGAATASSATSLTNSSAAFPTSGGPNSGLQGQIVVCMSSSSAIAYGVVMSNTATVLTVDKWHSFTSSTDATASTPSATTDYAVLPIAGFALWAGLSTNSATPAAGDVLRTADGLFADGTTSATATEQSSNGLARTFIQPTFPSAGNIQLQNTWTYTGSSAVNINKAVLCNSTAASGSLLFLETLLSATATVNANGDSIQLTWTISL